jgi:hypothetical protein
MYEKTGITSCPLTQFAVVFSAIIHDVDHPGVPNAQLVKEKSPLAEMYRNVSVAEQNRYAKRFHTRAHHGIGKNIG